jgi:hypothetical protein
MQFYNINFGYTQVLFMGSVPRINYLLATVFYRNNTYRPGLINYSYTLHLFQFIHLSFHLFPLFYRYDKLSKGVSIIFHQLPYTLQPVISYLITSNSKAA